MAISNPSKWRPGTAQWILASALVEAGLHSGVTDSRQLHRIRSAARSAVDPLVGTEPLVFSKNNGEPLPIDGQGRKCWHRLGEVLKAIQEHGWTPDSDPEPLPAPVVVEPEPVAPTTSTVDVRTCGESQRSAADVIGWIQGTLRPTVEGRNADGKPFDQIGLRPAENAARMLSQGIPADAIKHALTLHYPSEMRDRLGVSAFDPADFRPVNFGAVEGPADVLRHDGRHRAMPYVKALVAAGIPIALIGPPGTGKTTLAKDLATDLDLDFGMVSMTRGTSPSAFNGRPKIGSDGIGALVTALIANGKPQEALKIAEDAASNADVVESEFQSIFVNGGVWLYDEMDAADPNLLLLSNAPLANRMFSNPATGQKYGAHRNWIPVAGMNTLGLGGDRKMTGRERQDGAAMDRWHAGRVEVNLDPKLEAKIFWQIVAA